MSGLRHFHSRTGVYKTPWLGAVKVAPLHLMLKWHLTFYGYFFAHAGCIFIPVVCWGFPGVVTVESEFSLFIDRTEYARELRVSYSVLCQLYTLTLLPKSDWKPYVGSWHVDDGLAPFSRVRSEILMYYSSRNPSCLNGTNGTT